MKIKLLVALALVSVLSLITMVTASAALPANMSWVKYTGNPVVTSSQCYSDDHVRPALVWESTNNYKMYVSARGLGGPVDLYLLTTGDGGKTWSCANSSNPVLSRGTTGAWDDTRVEFVSVLKEGPSDYKMWYTGRNSSAVWGIGYAYSSDGISWTKYSSNPIVIAGAFGTWDSLRVMEPTVVKDGGTYHMWYTGEQVFPFSKIGHATATNPEGPWTKDVANPVFTGTPGTWDANQVYSPSVVFNTVDNSYEMFYSGQNGDRWITGHANATGPSFSWVKDANAILSPSGTGWETGDSLDYAGGLLDGTTWKLFYSQGGTYQVGLATLQNSAQLTFNPLLSSLAVGANQVVTIDLTSVTNLYGYQFEVHYNPAKVSATGAFVNTFFDTSGASGSAVPPGWNASCSAGVCKFAATRIRPATAVSSSGTLAQITFHGDAAGDSELTFASVLLGDKDGLTIPTTFNTGFITVYGTATISGSVALQGRTLPHDTFSVTLYDENGIVPPTSATVNTTLGTWTATVSAYGTMHYDAIASHLQYLSREKVDIVVAVGGSAAIGSTTLLGGDANNDGVIDIGDLTCIGGDFGKPPPPFGDCGGTGSPDINADNVINILDLVLAGGNYELSSPQDW